MAQGLKKSSGNSEATKPNRPVEPDAFSRILQSADFGFDHMPEEFAGEDDIKLLGPDAVLDWPFHDETGASNCNKAVQIPERFKPANLPLHDKLLESARRSTPDWLEEDKTNHDLPSWLTASSDNDLFAQKGLPQASRNTLPDWLSPNYRNALQEKGTELPEWMKTAEHTMPDWLNGDDLFARKGLPEEAKEKKVFDPNETQKVKAYNKQKRAYITLVVLILYFAFTLFAGSFFTFRVDEMISSLLGVYLYTIAQEHGYDLKFLLPRKK